MTRHLLLPLLILTAALSSGCFHLKKSASKPDAGLTREMEADFKTRWVEKRAAELVAQGRPAPAARTSAEAEFNERYGFTSAAQK